MEGNKTHNIIKILYIIVNSFFSIRRRTRSWNKEGLNSCRRLTSSLTKQTSFSGNKTISLSFTGRTRTKDKYRVVYSDHQRLELEKEFHYSRYITIRRKAELAQALSLSERQVSHVQLFVHLFVLGK